MTKNFSFWEMTKTSHSNLESKNQTDALLFMNQLKYTANTLEEIRAVLGVPMIVTSGFRNNALNKAVGGSPTSGHTKGLCADFKPLGILIKDAFNMIMENKSKCPSLKKAIMEKVGGSEWIHIETKTEANQPTQFFTTNNGRTYNEIKV
jgi:zinc D-Ala-D-Ala carboxypeptidase